MPQGLPPLLYEVPQSVVAGKALAALLPNRCRSALNPKVHWVQIPVNFGRYPPCLRIGGKRSFLIGANVVSQVIVGPKDVRPQRITEAPGQFWVYTRATSTSPYCYVFFARLIQTNDTIFTIPRPSLDILLGKINGIRKLYRLCHSKASLSNGLR